MIEAPGLRAAWLIFTRIWEGLLMVGIGIRVRERTVGGGPRRVYVQACIVSGGWGDMCVIK
jgi:hypothetical protein